MTTDVSEPDELRDIEAIRRLSIDCYFYCDVHELEKVVELFADDAYFYMPALERRVEGRQALREFFAELFEAIPHIIHFATNHRIDVSGDTAVGTFYFLSNGQTRDGRETELRGYYEDEYVRTPAGWRFKARTTRHLLPPRYANALDRDGETGGDV